MKLKNCPFCGSEALMTYGEVFCPNKNCIIGTMIFSKSKWNTRPAEQKLLEALKECYEQLRKSCNEKEIACVGSCDKCVLEKAKKVIEPVIEKYEVKG